MTPSKIVWVYFIFPLCRSIQVFERSSKYSDKHAVVEILDSGLKNLDQFTLCGRFKSPYLSSMPNIWQNLMYKSNFWFFGKIQAKITSTNMKIEANWNAQMYKSDLGKRVYFEFPNGRNNLM